MITRVAWSLGLAVPAIVGALAFIEPTSVYCPAKPIPLWLLLIVSPILEEIVFRGLLQGELKRFRFGNFEFASLTGANVTTSLIFAAVHTLRHGILGGLTFLPSLIIGWLYDGTSRISLCVVVHAFYNLCLLAALRCF